MNLALLFARDGLLSNQVAACPEELNKHLDTDLMISEQDHSLFPKNLREKLQDKGMHAVKGRQQSLRVFGIDTSGSVDIVHEVESS